MEIMSALGVWSRKLYKGKRSQGSKKYQLAIPFSIYYDETPFSYIKYLLRSPILKKP